MTGHWIGTGEHMSGERSPWARTLATVLCMANVFFRQEKYDEALNWYRRALSGKERSLGKDYPNTLITVHQMAIVFFRQGKYDEHSLGKRSPWERATQIRRSLSMVWQMYFRDLGRMTRH